jgi:hypothetical protein
VAQGRKYFPRRKHAARGSKGGNPAATDPEGSYQIEPLNSQQLIRSQFHSLYILKTKTKIKNNPT